MVAMASLRGATPAAAASSLAVNARPSMSASSMLARPGSPISAPISASLLCLSIVCRSDCGRDLIAQAAAILRRRP